MQNISIIDDWMILLWKTFPANSPILQEKYEFMKSNEYKSQLFKQTIKKIIKV